LELLVPLEHPDQLATRDNRDPKVSVEILDPAEVLVMLELWELQDRQETLVP
jgi:hypothetical protein